MKWLFASIVLVAAATAAHAQPVNFGEADIETTELPGLSRVHTAVFPEESPTAGESAKATERRPTFEMVRWMRIPNRVTTEP